MPKKPLSMYMHYYSERREAIQVKKNSLHSLTSVSDTDPHWFCSAGSDPYWECGSWSRSKENWPKLKKNWFPPFKIAFVLPYRWYDLWHITHLKYIFNVELNPDPHCFGSLDPDLDPHWGKKLDPDLHWNQCGSGTLSVSQRGEKPSR